MIVSLLAKFLVIATSMHDVQSNEKDIEFVFAGMQQERAKLLSGSYEVESTTREAGRTKSSVVFHGARLRMKRQYLDDKNRPPLSACDNGHTIAYWDPRERDCDLVKSTTKERDTLRHWDPRSAGLVLFNEPDYKKALSDRLQTWKQNFTSQTAGSLRTIGFNRAQSPLLTARLYLTVDVDRGFTPVRYYAESQHMARGEAPEKIEMNYEAIANWEQLDGIWVPVHHRRINTGGTNVEEHRLKWDWVNRPVNESEFNVEALGVPKTAKIIDFRNITKDRAYGVEVGQATLPADVQSANRIPYYVAAVLVIGIAVFAWIRMRMRS